MVPYRNITLFEFFLQFFPNLEVKKSVKRLISGNIFAPRMKAFGKGVA